MPPPAPCRSASSRSAARASPATRRRSWHPASSATSCTSARSGSGRGRSSTGAAAPGPATVRSTAASIADGVVTNPLAHAVATALADRRSRSARTTSWRSDTDLRRANDIDTDDTSSLVIELRVGTRIAAGARGDRRRAGTSPTSWCAARAATLCTSTRSTLLHVHRGRCGAARAPTTSRGPSLLDDLAAHIRDGSDAAVPLGAHRRLHRACSRRSSPGRPATRDRSRTRARRGIRRRDVPHRARRRGRRRARRLGRLARSATSACSDPARRQAPPRGPTPMIADASSSTAAVELRDDERRRLVEAVRRRVGVVELPHQQLHGRPSLLMRALLQRGEREHLGVGVVVDADHAQPLGNADAEPPRCDDRADRRPRRTRRRSPSGACGGRPAARPPRRSRPAWSPRSGHDGRMPRARRRAWRAR